jgi:hypothetical protein
MSTLVTPFKSRCALDKQLQLSRLMSDTKQKDKNDLAITVAFTVSTPTIIRLSEVDVHVEQCRAQRRRNPITEWSCSKQRTRSNK